MKHTFGTDVIGGLNVGQAAHKLAPSELTVSDNGWTVKEGVWSIIPGPTAVYTGYSNIVAMAAGRMSGATHVIWIDGTTLYDNGVLVADLSTYTASTAFTIKDFDDKFFIMATGDSYNYVYDGNHVRRHGPWQPFSGADKSLLTYGVAVTAATAEGIDAVTNADPAVMTMDSSHDVAVGQPVYIAGLGTMTQLNGGTYLVTAKTTNPPDASNTITIDVDASGFSAEASGSSGSAYIRGCGYAGTYRWYVTNIIKLSDNTVIESAPIGYGDLSSGTGKAWTSQEAKAYKVRPTDQVKIQIDDTWSGAYDISGTAGVDYNYGVRLYRTKNDGYDFYLENEWIASDVSQIYYSYKKDQDLGAVYTPAFSDYKVPPPATVMTLAAQRLWMNDTGNYDRLYYTHLDGTDYVPTLNYLTFPDRITAIGSAGDVVVVFSADRMWRVTILGGVPDVDEIKTPVGTTYGNALVLTDLGLLFLRGDGLWATDGASPPTKVSRKAFETITSPRAVAAYGDTLILMGSGSSYVTRRRDGGMYWHGPSDAYLGVDATGGTFYAYDKYNIYTLFTGAKGRGAIESPTFTARQELKATAVILDVDNSVIDAVLVNGNRYSDDLEHEDGSEVSDRRLVRLPIPRLMNHAFTVRIETSGDGDVYGYWLECE